VQPPFSAGSLNFSSSTPVTTSVQRVVCPPTDGEVEWIELDLTDGRGIDEVITDVDIVVHAASNARGDSEAVDVHGTERLLEAAAEADMVNFVYVSIVGSDGIPYIYYEHKREVERIIEASAVPSTLSRSTQFHPFVAYLLATVNRLPIWPLPTEFQHQPIDAGEAADRIADCATVEAAGRVPDIGGPSVLTVRQLAETYREAPGLRRPVFRLPIPGDRRPFVLARRLAQTARSGRERGKSGS
jgi:uncharacterized protein YbjT (DUF2867 family)